MLIQASTCRNTQISIRMCHHLSFCHTESIVIGHYIHSYIQNQIQVPNEKFYIASLHTTEPTMIRTLKLVAGIATAVEVLWISRSPDIASQLSSISLNIIIKLKQNQSTTESRSNNTNVKPSPNSNRSQQMKSPNRNAERRMFNRLILMNANLNNNSIHKTKQND